MTNFDFSKVSKPKARSADADWSNPVSFFYKLAHPAIRDLYPIQRDILQNWYSEFKAGVNDKMVALNTGGGKTLIGLMIAESVRRETSGKVLYVCPNNFLGKQTLDESKKYGSQVACYLKSRWENKDLFLDNRVPCITNYASVFNARSIFKELEIKGIIFDDAHLSLNILDDQFTLKVENGDSLKKITDIFKSSPVIKEKIASIQEGDPLSLVMIPPLEWHRQSENVKSILANDGEISSGLQWINLKEKIDKTFCFISAKKAEISLLYPDINKHYAFHKEVNRVYLSATLPNLDDITRVFGVTPSRINTDNPDYRPQRLFLFSRKLKIENAENSIRADMSSICPKTFILVPSREKATPYKAIGAEVAENADDVIQKVATFKTTSNGILVLANRYDGIDLPGGTCHCLLVDGLPYTGTLKTKFFSEYFHNHRNSFLRSVVASKLIQAFGRTIRANNDFSVIFVFGDKLNSWVIDRDNRKFFKTDLSEDIEMGLAISETIASMDGLKSLTNEILGQTENWKKFFDERKSDIGTQAALSQEDEDKGISLAKSEREIHDLFMRGYYQDCLEKILEREKALGENSKPILGLYLSIGAICCLEENDNHRLQELSARAYGINPIFGLPVVVDSSQKSLQAQRIIDFDKTLPTFDWNLKDKAFDESLRQFGEVLGFAGIRPEADGDGTLDVCWEDEERKVVVGFENKVNKTNKTLSKHDIDQCSGHANWLEQSFPDYSRTLFIVGDIENYNELGSPLNLLHLNVAELKRIEPMILQIHSKRIHPNQIDPSLDSQKLRIDKLFPVNKVVDLPKVRT